MKFFPESVYIESGHQKSNISETCYKLLNTMMHVLCKLKTENHHNHSVDERRESTR